VLAPRNFAAFEMPHSRTPVDLEIGCGTGWRPIRYAKENPGRKLVAIEHTREKFQKFEGRLARHPELKNLVAIHADAVAWVTHALLPQSISRCFFFYPNPEPKAASRRWIRRPFFAELLRKMKMGGEILFVTNEEFYAREVKAYAENIWKLETILDRRFTQGEQEARTHFEKKYLLRGESCYELGLKKIENGPLHQDEDHSR
jgi:tRNA G46 methylase TrmB